MKTVDCYRPGCYCTLDHQVDLGNGSHVVVVVCPRCRHHRLVIGRLRGDL